MAFASRLREIADELDEFFADPEAVGLIESIIGIFGEDWWESQNDLRLSRWYERAKMHVAAKKPRLRPLTVAEFLALDLPPRDKS